MAVGTRLSRRPRPRWPLTILGALLIPAACTAWIFVSHDPARHLAVLDELELPHELEVVRTDGDWVTLFGPRAVRYYLVDADPVDVAPMIKAALLASGFEIYYSPVPGGGCATDPEDSAHPICGNVVSKDCLSNGPTGPVNCYIEGYRAIDSDPQHLEDVFVSVSPRGSTVDLGSGASPRYLARPDLATVVITASLSDLRHFWSAPTPTAAASGALGSPG
jgi:hypothetical protein